MALLPHAPDGPLGLPCCSAARLGTQALQSSPVPTTAGHRGWLQLHRCCAVTCRGARLLPWSCRRAREQRRGTARCLPTALPPSASRRELKNPRREAESGAARRRTRPKPARSSPSGGRGGDRPSRSRPRSRGGALGRAPGEGGASSRARACAPPSRASHWWRASPCACALPARGRRYRGVCSGGGSHGWGCDMARPLLLLLVLLLLVLLLVLLPVLLQMLPPMPPPPSGNGKWGRGAGVACACLACAHWFAQARPSPSLAGARVRPARGLPSARGAGGPGGQRPEAAGGIRRPLTPCRPPQPPCPAATRTSSSASPAPPASPGSGSAMGTPTARTGRTSGAAGRRPRQSRALTTPG